jgi:NTE family protein
MIDLRNKRIGIVLSGGGAKGAYQVGMFRALDELGLSSQIKAMSGCSIGAYAETIYAVAGVEEYKHFLESFESMMTSGISLDDDEMENSKHEVQNRMVSITEYVSQRRFWKYQAVELHEYIKKLVSKGTVEKTKIPMTVCCYSLEAQKPVYFRLSDLNNDEQTMAIIGSGSLQYLFEPAMIQGHHCLDGGIVPDICTSPKPADKVPLEPMLQEPVDFVLINFLTAQDRAELSLIPPYIDYLELRPSIPLEDLPGSGTLDFSPQIMQMREKTGYKDTMELLCKNCIF